MGLMDKVKAQATELAQQGKAKYDQVQATRRADAMLRNLGALVFKERTGRAAPDSQAQIDKTVADLSAHEAANGINLSPEPTDGPGQPGQPGASQPGPGQPQGGTAGPTTTFPPEADTNTTTQV
jgi:hypothetical protein